MAAASLPPKKYPLIEDFKADEYLTNLKREIDVKLEEKQNEVSGEVTQIKTSIQQLNQRNEELERATEVLRRTLEESSAEQNLVNSGYEAAMARARDALQTQTEANELQQREISALREVQQDASRQLNEIEAENEALQEQLETVNSELTILKDRTATKITEQINISDINREVSELLADVEQFNANATQETEEPELPTSSNAANTNAAQFQKLLKL